MIVVVYSFNDSRLNAEWVGFTFDWYDKLFHNEDMLAAAGNSLAIGLVASLVSTVLGTMAGVAMYRYRLRLLPVLVLAPIAIPEILMGVSLLIFFVLLNFTLGLVSVALAHIAFCIGFVAIVVRSRLAGMDESADRGRPRLRRHALAGVPLRDAAAHHAGRDRRRADGVHAVDRRLRHHLLHRRRRDRDAAAADLLDDQDRRDARGQRRVDAADAADVGADHHRLQAFAHPPAIRPGLTMKRLAARSLPRCSSPCRRTAAKDQLHLYNWNNYIAPETVKRFEETCKCEVVQTYYSDNEELLAKLAAGAKGYDVLVPTSNAVEALIKGGQLMPIDKAKLPNLKNIDPVYLNTPFDPGNKYSVPYAMSTTIIGYNDEKMKELGLPTDTWAVIFDPKYLEKVKGRVTVLDSANELFAAALKYLGYSANDVDPKHWDEAAALIKKAKPYWAAFNASSYIKELTVGNIWLVHGYSNDIFQANLDAQAAGRKFTILQGMPKEGAVLAVDNMVIQKGAPRPDLALQFMNFMLEGKNSAELTNLIGSGNPNMDAIKYIKPELLKNPAIFPDKAVQAKLEQLKDLTAAAAPAAQQAVDGDQGRAADRRSARR